MNVLFIVIDTLRADHLGCYGYHRNTSPYIDEFADGAVLFENAFAAGIPTHPAFATLFSGQHPITHGVVAHGGKRAVPRSAPWLPELMLKNGFTTCATDNLADTRLGFDRGYEFYIDPTRRRTLSINSDNREINARAIPWLEHHAAEPFFMLVHYWDPHTPYLPPRAYRTLFYEGNDPRDPANTSLDGMENHPLGKTWRETWFNKLGGHVTDAEYIVSLYDGELRYCDEGVGALLETLESCGLADRTLVVITADHGELMYRHGIFFDHHGLYDGNIHVPLMIRYPGPAPQRIPDIVSAADIAPTALDLCGIPPPGAGFAQNEPAEGMDGVSLAPLIRGEPSAARGREFVVSEECTWQMKWAIRTTGHKLIIARRPDFYGNPQRELYDLEADPGEFDNIAEREPERARNLEHRLESWIAEKMRENGLDEDPLITHGLTLGARHTPCQNPP